MKIQTGWSVLKHEMSQGVPRMSDLIDAGKFPGQEGIRELRESGITIVPGFWSREKCAEVVAKIDELISTRREDLWIDDVESDHRIYGAENVIPECREFAENEEFSDLMSAHEGKEVISFALAARLDSTEDNPGSGGGWHRDQALAIQSKAMIYLVDVEEGNGPFEYIKGSHTRSFLIRSAFKEGFELGKNRYTDEEAGSYSESSRVVTGQAGDLVLFNSRGLHRGQPIVNGTRYAITNYYFAKDHGFPSHIQKLFIEE